MNTVIRNALILAKYEQLKSIEISKGVNMNLNLISEYDTIINRAKSNKY